MKSSESKKITKVPKPYPGTMADYELALEEGSKKIRRSKKTAIAFLKRAGILDKNGKLIVD